MYTLVRATPLATVRLPRNFAAKGRAPGRNPDSVVAVLLPLRVRSWRVRRPALILTTPWTDLTPEARTVTTNLTRPRPRAVATTLSVGVDFTTAVLGARSTSVV